MAANPLLICAAFHSPFFLSAYIPPCLSPSCINDNDMTRHVAWYTYARYE